MGFRKLLTFFFFLLLLLIIPSYCNASEKVSVALYYETLCPYCADFIVNHLVKLFQNGLISIINLRLVPWGNAWLNSDGSFSCQVKNNPLPPLLCSSFSFPLLVLATNQLYMSQTTSFLAAQYFFFYFFLYLWGLLSCGPVLLWCLPVPISQLPSFVLLLLSLFWVLQHGSDECLLNTIEACTISIYPDVVSSSSMPPKKETNLTHRPKPK